MQKPDFRIATAMPCVVVVTLDIFSLTSPAPRRRDTKKLLKTTSMVQQRGVGEITKESKGRRLLPSEKIL